VQQRPAFAQARIERFDVALRERQATREATEAPAA
jgi:uncharacterized small protein (DUF1192 family)